MGPYLSWDTSVSWDRARSKAGLTSVNQKHMCESGGSEASAANTDRAIVGGRDARIPGEPQGEPISL